MSKLLESPEKKTDVMGTMKAKQKVIGLAVLIFATAAVCIAVAITVQRAAGYKEIKQQNEELQSSLAEMTKKLEDFEEIQKRLTYSEEQVELYKKSTNALIQQVSGLKAENEDLNNRIKELVNIVDTVPVVTRSILEEQISALSELVTQKYMYRNAKQMSSDKTWLWGWTMPFSDVSLLATYDGTITASIDLKEVKFSVNEGTKTITVTIPSSKVFDHNIPQETINVLEVKNNLFNKVTFDDYNKFIAAEKAEMEQVAVDHGFLTEADEEAQRVIEAFLKTVPGIDAYILKFN